MDILLIGLNITKKEKDGNWKNSIESNKVDTLFNRPNVIKVSKRL